MPSSKNAHFQSLNCLTLQFFVVEASGSTNTTFTGEKAMPANSDLIESYIAGFPPEVQVILQEMRRVISEAAPLAIERIAYSIPTFHWKENLVHFAGYKRHIGFYPTGTGIEAFQDRFEGWKTSRGAVQFPLNMPIPYDLVAEITRWRVEQVAKSQVA
jgi:uncharacterized protein YdhG (YjbR/CyaY superfamily)